MPDETDIPDDTDSADPEVQQTEDLEYDLAHEATAGADAQPAREEPVYVPTETKDYAGDYGYDLAHDVPGR